MNRYTVAGVLSDMRRGLGVLVLSRTAVDARAAFALVASYTEPGETIRSTAGRERITAASGPGRVAFGPSGGDRWRGLTFDVVVCDAHEPRNLAAIEPVLLTSPVGEVIRT